MKLVLADADLPRTHDLEFLLRHAALLAAPRP
jgi:hypothetical protein